MNKIITCIVFLFLITASPVLAEDKELSIDIGTTVTSDYMFRGFNLYEGTSIQPSVALGYDLGSFGSIGTGVWSHITAEHPSDETTFTEIDYDLNWSKEFGDISVVLGHLWYTYPHDRAGIFPTTNEFYTSISYDTFLSPVFSVYYDYDAFDTQFYELGFSHEVTSESLGEGFNVTPYVSFGFATDSEKVYADDGLVVIASGLSSNLSLGDISVVPGVHYSFKVDDNTIDRFWFDLNLGYSF